MKLFPLRLNFLIIVSLIGLALTVPVMAVKVKSAPRQRPVVIGKVAKKRVKIRKATETHDLKAQERKIREIELTGIEMVVPSELATLPIYRVTRPGGEAIPGLEGQWAEWLLEEAETTQAAAPSMTQAATQAFSPTNGSGERSQKVQVPSGSYSVGFSMPLAPVNLFDPNAPFVAPVLWSQPVRVKRGKFTRLEVHVPDLSSDAVAQVQLRADGPTAPFNSFSLDRIDTPGKEGLSSHWDFIEPKAGWPSAVHLTLLKGRYRVVLGASSFGAFSSLRYELPEPLDITTSGPVVLPMPTFHRLRVKVTDREGSPLAGLPLMFKGQGDTHVFADSGQGQVDVRLPPGRYSVRALIFTEKGQREVTLERALEMTGDQERTWKAPVKSLFRGL